MADTFVEFADYNKSNLYLGTKQQLRSRRLSTTACAWSPRSQLLFGPRQATRSIVGGGESALHVETQLLHVCKNDSLVNLARMLSSLRRL